MTPAHHPSVNDDASAALEADAGRVFDAYLADREAGRPADPEGLLAAHPHLADRLRACLDVMRWADRLASGPEVPAGLRLGDFRIVREIGRGGMGVVYEAEQLSLGRRVALKVLPFAAALDPRQLQRFRVEAHAAAHLHHTNIVPIYAVGVERGVHYYAMQYVEGRTVADVIRELRRLDGLEPATPDTPDAATWVLASRLTSDLATPDEPVAAAVSSPPPAPAERSPAAPGSGSSIRTKAYFQAVARLGVQAAEALAHAHDEGVLHRDVKPSNLLVDDRGKLWITDFGLARFQSDNGLTLTGDLIGTLRYMSPEQALAKRVVIDERTDIYSLGVTLYELLTLRAAFEGRDRQELLRRIAEEDPRPPRALNSSVPADLETIILKATAKEPEGRYGSAQELADDLRRYLEHRPIRARRPTLWERATKWAWRHRAVVSSAAIILVVGMISSGAATVLLWREQMQTAQAYRAELNQRKLLGANLRLALQALDKVYLTTAETRITRGEGLDPKDRELLQETLAFYEQFSEANRDSAYVRYEVACAYDRAGGLRNLLGDRVRARDNYQRAIALLETLTIESPSEQSGWHRLAKVTSDFAFLLEDIGQFDEAERAHHQALDIHERLVRDHPEQSEYRNDVASTQGNLEVHLRTIGRPEEANDFSRKALTAREVLVRDHPAVPRYRRDLAVSYINIGVRAWSGGDNRAAADSYSRALPILERLVADEPGNADHRKHLGVCCHNLCVVLGLDRREEKERFGKRAIALREQLANEFPQVPEYRNALAASYDERGIDSAVGGRLDEAEGAWRKAVDLWEDLARRFPEIPDYRSRLGGVYNNLAIGLTGRGDLVGARQLLEQAVAHQQSALRSNPKNPVWRRFLGNHYHQQIEVLTRLGERVGAAETAEELANLDPNNWNGAFRAAEILIRFMPPGGGTTDTVGKGNGTGVRDFAGEASALLREAARRSESDPVGLNAIAWLLATCPDAHFRDPSRAVQLAQTAVKLRPNEAAFWNTLGMAQYRIGNWEAAVMAMQTSMERNSGGDANDWFILAMAHKRQGGEKVARGWYDRAVEWMDKNQPQNDELNRFRAESATLLGLADLPADVFARP